MLKKLASTPISQINLRQPARARPTAPLIEVVTLMRERRRGATIIEDEGGPILGIFTERDLMLRVDHSDHTWHGRAVAEVMTRDPISLPMSATLAAALRRMKDGRFRHLPVVDDRGRAAGVLSIRDILAHIVEYYPQEFINLPPDPGHEAHRRWGG